MDTEAIANVIEELKKMLEYFETSNLHYIRGMSVFIAVDTEKKSQVVKLIDLSSFELIPQENFGSIQRDDGIIKGLESLIKLLEETNVYKAF